MALLGNLAASDFGYVSVGTLLDRTRQALRTMEELPRHRWALPHGASPKVATAFGVPGLGRKQGLQEDMVVAPYATALALMIAPGTACANLEVMAARGFLGRYGFYEAADYTPSRVRPGQEFSLVRSHMAHHSGMPGTATASWTLSSA
jgi:hypothetical protein